jgi:hypothetical protein
VSDQVLAPAAWAQRHFGQVQLGDKRLNDRVVQMAQRMAADPSASIPGQHRQWKQIKGAYRLPSHERADFVSLSRGHWQQTHDQCAAAGGGVMLLIQDTTWLDYSRHPGTRGLGWHSEEPPYAARGQRAAVAQRAGGTASGSGARSRHRSDPRGTVGTRRRADRPGRSAGTLCPPTQRRPRVAALE